MQTEHLQGIAALLRYEEYYVKESAIQILCALGVDTLLLFVDDILRYSSFRNPCLTLRIL
jgi:hypothetical protein